MCGCMWCFGNWSDWIGGNAGWHICFALSTSVVAECPPLWRPHGYPYPPPCPFRTQGRFTILLCHACSAADITKLGLTHFQMACSQAQLISLKQPHAVCEVGGSTPDLSHGDLRIFPCWRPNRGNCTLLLKQQTHWGRPFQSA